MRCVLWALALVLATPPALAQERARELTIGAGVGLTPDYEGSSDYQALPLLSFEYVARKIAVRSRGLGLEADMIPGMQFQFGPTFNYRFGRGDDVEDRRVEALPNVNDSVELGLFAATGAPLRTLGVDDPAILTARVSVAQDVADGHEGLLVTGSVGGFRPLGEQWSGFASLSTTYANEAYMHSFFSISQASAAASGLTRFKADAGFKDIGLTAGLTYKFADKWSATFLGAYTRLLGDAADSPVTDDAGSANQFFGGLSINYRVY